MRQSCVENELCFRHEKGVLILIMTIHVDDLRVAGRHEVVQELLGILELEFGELTIQRGTFTNCGVQHIQNPIAREITLDHIDFVSNLRTIEHRQLATGTNEEKCVPALHQLFISLLGAIAYATHTRVDVMAVSYTHLTLPTILRV